MSDKNQKSKHRLVAILIYSIAIIIGSIVANLIIHGFTATSLSDFFAPIHLIALILISLIVSLLIVMTNEKIRKRKKT